MENFREFQGNDLDACIKQALNYFDCQRENLEVEIIQDAKNGIFGIVGARKAKIRARRARLEDAVASILGQKEERSAPVPDTKASMPRGQKSETGRQEQPAGKKTEAARPAQQQKEKKELVPPRKRPERKEKMAEEPKENAKLQKVGPVAPVSKPAHIGKEPEEDYFDVNLADLDQEKLRASSMEIVSTLISPIVGDDFDLSPDFAHNRPIMHIQGNWEPGILIGRDGQTLIALEYLASRMLSRAMDAPLRLHLDIGNYRARQDGKLRELARSMADRVRQTGRQLSTRPLSSYHRRIIHLTLQDQPDVQTRSSGEGPLKRVLVCPRRQCPPSRP